ncbi:MAG: hypothetical protein R2788_06330 [Saprospiraceae bacterium]
MGTDVTALVPDFTFSNGAVPEVNGVDQESGVTANDFTSATVVYSVTSSDMSLTTDYTVTVKVMGATSDEWNSSPPMRVSAISRPAGILNGEIYVIDTSVAVGGRISSRFGRARTALLGVR